VATSLVSAGNTGGGVAGVAKAPQDIADSAVANNEKLGVLWIPTSLPYIVM